MQFKRWNTNLRGCHVIQHIPENMLPVDQPEDIGKYVEELLLGKGRFSSQGGLICPVAVIVNLRKSPDRTHSHPVSRTDRSAISIRAALTNALRKYPHTESILIEGGENFILYSGVKFNDQL